MDPVNNVKEWLPQLVTLAQAASVNVDYVPLGAHIYARMLVIESSWNVTTHDPNVRLRSAQTTERDIPQLLMLIANDTDPSSIYWDLNYVLWLVDCTLAGRHDTNWDGTVELSAPLSGKVQVWGKRRLKAPGEEPTRAGPEPVRAGPEPNTLLTNVRFAWQRGRVCNINKVGYELSRQADSLYLINDRHHEVDVLRVALCPLTREFHPYFELTSPPERFHIRRSNSIMRPDLLKAHLSMLIEEAAKQSVHLLVLPELNVCEIAREHITRALGDTASEYPYAVLAGSFHIWTKTEGASSEAQVQGTPVNEAVLLTRTIGAMSHKKRGRFMLPASAVTNEFFPDLVAPTQEPYVAEDIWRGSTLNFLETVFGTVAILICADLIDLRDDGLRSVVQELRPDVLFGVAMTSETELFEEKARDFSKFGISTLIVNAACACGEAQAGQVPCLAIAHLARFEDDPTEENPNPPPAFVRWRADTFLLERWDFHLKRWSTLDPGSEQAISWLHLGSDRVALIVDCGPQEAL